MLFAMTMLGIVLARPRRRLLRRPANAHSKVARDLQAGIAVGNTPAVNWARDIHGARYVQVIVVSNSADPEMTDLRAFVLRTGGSVLARHSGIHALTVLMKAGTVNAMAQRNDVVSVSPNREARQTASTLESITGALTSKRRSNKQHKDRLQRLGWQRNRDRRDGFGVMKAHDGFRDSSGVTRVARNVDMFNSSVANWTMGVDTTASLQPGSSALNSYEALIATDDDATQDPFGHGTHVAAVAAGRAKYYGWGTPDTTGIAPNAKIFDVRVLDDHGSGTVSDAIEGIQWVIYHAKQYNIRVLNVSLAASSTETWQTDPLCIAVRSATAVGITVVVAAGNFGQSTFGQEVYGAVSAPGNDPSVITVGAVNYHDTVARGDDTVNNFSSRGPTRSSYISSSGVRVVDNLLKPISWARAKIVTPRPPQRISYIPTWNFWPPPFTALGRATRASSKIYPEPNDHERDLDRRQAVSGAVALSCRPTGAHATADQGDPAIPRAAAADLQPGPAGRRDAQHRRCDRISQRAQDRYRHPDRIE